jgi:hypothetical protein
MTENKAQDVVAAPESEPAATISHCRFCKRPSQCPNSDCKQALDPEKPKGTNTVNIDADVPDIHNQLPAYPNPLPHKNKAYAHCMPPEAPIYQEYSVFLAGSIEMGNAIQWQRQMAVHLQDLPISVYNPRRGQWDPKATQEAKNASFRHQVEWELDALQQAKVICFFFDHDTMSPVTMCELGLWAHSGKVVVCCNKKFWKGGNVHIVCERYGIPMVEEFTQLEPLIRAMLRQKGMMLDKEGNLTTDPAKAVNGLPGEEVLKAAGQKAPVLKNAELGTA